MSKKSKAGPSDDCADKAKNIACSNEAVNEVVKSDTPTTPSGNFSEFTNLSMEEQVFLYISPFIHITIRFCLNMLLSFIMVYI